MSTASRTSLRTAARCRPLAALHGAIFACVLVALHPAMGLASAQAPSGPLVASSLRRDAHLTIKASLSTEPAHMSGQITARFDGEACPSGASVAWLLPPERFDSPPGVGGELLERRVSPGRFDPAGMTLVGAGPVQDAPVGGWGPHALAPAVQEGGAWGSTVRFESHIPHRFGVYGEARGQVSLQGGWFPEPILLCSGERPEVSLPPGSPRYDVSLSLSLPPGWSALAGRAFHAATDATSPQRLTRSLKGVDAVTLVAGPELRRIPMDLAPDVMLVGAHIGLRQRRGLEAALVKALEGWASLNVAELDAGPVVALVPDRRHLVTEGGGVILLSDRLMGVHPAVRSIHEGPVIQAVFRDRLHALLSQGELPASQQAWVADGLAYSLFEAFSIASRGGVFDVEAAIRPVAFLPAFDQLLYAPRFPFAGEIYGSPFLLDALLEDVRAFHQPIPPGRVLFIKLADRFGPEAVEIAGGVALGGGAFVPALAAAAGVDEAAVASFLGGWLGPYPQENLSIVKAVEGAAAGGIGAAGDGRWQATGSAKADGGRALRVQRTGDGPLPEEVITVSYPDGEARWVAPAATQSEPVMQRSEVFYVGAPGPRRPVVVDPERHVLEVRDDALVMRGDNRLPPAWKAIFGASVRSLSPAQGRVTFDAGVSLMPRYDRRHLVAVDVLSDDRRFGGLALGYFHYFGAARDAVWRRHRVGLTLGADLLREDAAGGPYEGDISLLPGVSITGGYRYASRQTQFNPGRGAQLAASAQVGRLAGQALIVELPTADSGAITVVGAAAGEGAGAPFSLLRASALGLHSPAPRTVLAGYLRGAVTTGGVTPDLVLGGGTGVRGIPVSAAAGRERLIASAELRQELYRDGNLDLGIYRLRGVQGALLADVGLVHRPGEGAQWAWSGGVGVRFHADALGVQQGLLGIDVVWGAVVSAPWAATPQVYLRFTQAF